MHAAREIQTRNPSKRSAADPRLRSLDHWDGLNKAKKQPGLCLSESWKAFTLTAFRNTSSATIHCQKLLIAYVLSLHYLEIQA
jgi:hypothetical protein